MTNEISLEGGCDCGAVRYRMTRAPMIVHCCHCRWCQRETGASFALNAMVEADRVDLLKGEPQAVDTPSNSGKGQKIFAARPAGSPSGATMPGPATRCASFVSARWTNRTACRPISTSSPARSSLGSCFRRTRPPSSSSTVRRTCGPTRALRAAKPSSANARGVVK